jgi:hypothetical protein
VVSCPAGTGLHLTSLLSKRTVTHRDTLTDAIDPFLFLVIPFPPVNDAVKVFLFFVYPLILPSDK